MEALKNIETPKLLAYMNVLENVTVSHGQILNTCVDFIAKGLYEPSELQDFVTKSQMAQSEANEIYFKIQKELDVRLKRDIGLQFGIRRSQSHIERFENFLDKKSKEKVEQQMSKQKAAMELIKEDQEKTESADDTAAE